jgi:hypothetical protein
MGFYDRHRDMYAGGRPDAAARRSNRVMSFLAARGVFGWWLVRLETINPKSRTLLSLPLVTAHVGGEYYLVSMLGTGSRWVRNVLAAGGLVTVTVGWRRSVRLVEVPVAVRAPIIKNYLQRAPGGRPHIPVDKDAPLPDFEAIAPDFPVFEIRRR